MGRERCPRSKEVDVYSMPKRCNTCRFAWTGKERMRTPKKDKVRS